MSISTIMMKLPFLSLLTWLPILGGGLLLSLPRNKKNLFKARALSLGITVFCFALSLFLAREFNNNTFEMQWTEFLNWLPSVGIHYHLGVDGFSLPLIILTCFMTILVILSSIHSVTDATAVTRYLSAFLIMQGLIIGALSSLDAILFYTFWEGMLIPMFLIIGIWGSTNRIYATLKFFLYTFLGSVLLLVSLIYLHHKALTLGVPLQNSFSILTFHNLPLSFEAQRWLFIALLIAFAVKVPMWPVHTWLPDAHVEAPTGGSVILAAILLKMGGYGFLRFLLPILPDASDHFAWPVIILSLIAIAYIAFVALVQKDMKKLIAYSSISHMGFVTLGFFLVFVMTNLTPESEAAISSLSVEAGIVQMISHGFVSAALFLCVGVLYDRMHTRLIRDYGGVINSMPLFGAFFVLFAMANVGLPGTSGFVGEFLVIISSFKANLWTALTASSILVMGAAYTLWMTKRVIFGVPLTPSIAALPDLKKTETLIFGLLTIAIIALGVFPAPLLDMLHTSSSHLITQMLHSKI